MNSIRMLIWKEIIDNLQYKISPKFIELKGKAYSQQWWEIQKSR